MHRKEKDMNLKKISDNIVLNEFLNDHKIIKKTSNAYYSKEGRPGVFELFASKTDKYAEFISLDGAVFQDSVVSDGKVSENGEPYEFMRSSGAAFIIYTGIFKAGDMEYECFIDAENMKMFMMNLDMARVFMEKFVDMRKNIISDDFMFQMLNLLLSAQTSGSEDIYDEFAPVIVKRK